MQVKIDFTVDIDATAWINNYGCEAQEVRDDVERHAKYIVMSELDVMEALTEEKPMARKNPVARNLRSPRYRKQVVESRVKYTRKKKHAGEEK